MTDDLIDDLVADLITTESQHLEVSRVAIERLTTQYPELTERYGDWNLGLDFRGPGGRLVRADIHRTLREKGMSLRAIAAETGVGEATVRRDLAPDDAPDPLPIAPDDAPPDEPPTEGLEPAAEVGPGPLWKPLDQELKAIRKLSDTPATEVAASVPAKRRDATAKRLRRLGSYLGAVASKLEDLP